MKLRNAMHAAAFGFALVGAGLTASSLPAHAVDASVQVGGAPMYPSKNIIQNAVNSKDHTTLVAAVKAAGLVDTLQSAGPFTVFAPVNTAFEKLPAGTVPTLLKPENKATLTTVLTYHVVAGKYSAQDLEKLLDGNGGRAMLKTVQGGSLTVTEAGRGRLQITDAKGDVSTITIADVNQSNGVIHVVDTVLLPG
jgi:uncharacterized surface protein with fasciclin (FAS1) repeats